MRMKIIRMECDSTPTDNVVTLEISCDFDTAMIVRRMCDLQDERLRDELVNLVASAAALETAAKTVAKPGGFVELPRIAEDDLYRRLEAAQRSKQPSGAKSRKLAREEERRRQQQPDARFRELDLEETEK